MDENKENKPRTLVDIILGVLRHKYFLAGSAVVVLLGVLISILLPKKEFELPWNAFRIQDLSDDAMVQMGGGKSSFQQFVSTFTTKEGSAIPVLWLLHEEENDRSTPLVLKARGEELRFGDQVLLGRLWVARGNKKEEERVHREFLKDYPEFKVDSKSDLLWYEALEYLRWRMESYQVYRNPTTLHEIKDLSARILPLFMDHYPPGISEIFRANATVVVASLEKEDKKTNGVEETEKLIIPLASIDLSVFRALVSIDPAWEEIADFWQDKLLAARLSNGFSAYAIDHESGEYLPSYHEQFQVKTEAFLHQELVLAEAGFENQKSRAITFQLLENDRYLRRIYHMASQMKMDEEYDLLAMNEMYEIAKIENDQLTQNLLQNRMKDLIIEEYDIALSGFIPEEKAEERYFSFELNAKALLSGLIIP